MTDQGRLLPWTTLDGNPCYVVGDGAGYVSRMADDVEDVQLGMADELLGHADAILAAHRATGAELRYLARRLVESLSDVRRIAESRGARLEKGGALVLHHTPAEMEHQAPNDQDAG
ncbi:hypothetical protein [Streptomyces sp. MBT65]|uniref:hypothetical protein n=1 Tax=Streptomyces sp. MBT65 TaxID=1488395 RepID=UPI0027DA8C9B|nr:hypothetical protein [Streptomyces sp. MBT65]